MAVKYKFMNNADVVGSIKPVLPSAEETRHNMKGSTDNSDLESSVVSGRWIKNEDQCHERPDRHSAMCLLLVMP